MPRSNRDTYNRCPAASNSVMGLDWVQAPANTVTIPNQLVVGYQNDVEPTQKKDDPAKMHKENL
jgi:hypothetical protein